MKCKHVQQKMLDYTEHVLNSHVQQQVTHHLQTCRECSQELEAIQGTLELLSSSPSFQDPPESFWNDFTMDVMRKVRAAEPPEPTHLSFSTWQMRLAMACALLLVMMAGLYAYQALRPQAPIMTTQTDAPREDPAIPPALDTALQRLVPEELPLDMLDTEFALFDDMGSPALESPSSDTALEGLLSGLSDEEKRALLLELYKMREPSQ